jgi:hypothetical protein
MQKPLVELAKELVIAAQRVGLTREDVCRLLENGATIDGLLLLIEKQPTSPWVM